MKELGIILEDTPDGSPLKWEEVSILWPDRPNIEIDTISPLTLAYIGDAVYELYVRLMLISAGNRR